MSAVSHMALLGMASLTLQNAVTPLTLTANRATWGNFTIRQIISSANIIKAGTGVQVTLEAPSGTSLGVLAAYIGERSGSTTSFASTPVQLLWSGSGTPTISAGTSLASDTAAFTITGSSDLIVAVYANQSNRREKTGATSGYACWYKSGNDASTVSTSGYSDFSGTAAVTDFKSMQVYA